MKPEDLIGKYGVRLEGTHRDRVIHVRTIDEDQERIFVQGAGVIRRGYDDPISIIAGYREHECGDFAPSDCVEFFDTQEELLRAYPDNVLVLHFLTEVL